MGATAWKTVRSLLKQTSRSFYLTLRVLPWRVRTQIGVAYLLARTTDTIADTDLVPLDQRLQGLKDLRERIIGLRKTPVDFGELAKQQGVEAERTLLEKTEVSVTLLRTLDDADLELVLKVLNLITTGQEMDLHRFAGGKPQRVASLHVESELDEYTWLVAGCVGEFWTKLCRRHVFPRAQLDDAQLLADAARFGKGLQLVNILRDLAADLRLGRCYLPDQELFKVTSLLPADLLDPANAEKFRPLYHRYLDLAETYLAAGWNYTNNLPWRCIRVRLACAWPILIGVQTLARLRTANPLDASQKVKLPRANVRGILWRSVLRYPFPAAWRDLAPLPANLAARNGNKVSK
ncbi:MAG: squalene/phytoene synthase family protein [Pedosphaera sp.]|nr:squalene/phytoene synthase family protein [Pedosphaera sp.]